jgi:hypothetical protein
MSSYSSPCSTGVKGQPLSNRPCRNLDAEMVDRGPLAWPPVRLETENVEFDTGCLGTAAETNGVREVIHKESQTWIERESRYKYRDNCILKMQDSIHPVKV